MKKGFFKTFAKFIGKHLCWSVFFNKVAYYEEYPRMLLLHELHIFPF